ERIARGGARLVVSSERLCSVRRDGEQWQEVGLKEWNVVRALVAALVAGPGNARVPGVLPQLQVQRGVGRAGVGRPEADTSRRGGPAPVRRTKESHAQSQRQEVAPAVEDVDATAGAAQGRPQVVLRR